MRFLKILWPSYNIWTLIGSLSFRNLSTCSRSKQESFLSSSQHHFLVFSHISQILLLFTSAAFWWDSSLKKMSTVCPRADLKFIYSEKATKFCEIFTLLLTTVHTVKSKMKILRNFVAFSEYMRFTLIQNGLWFNLQLI